MRAPEKPIESIHPLFRDLVRKKKLGRLTRHGKFCGQKHLMNVARCRKGCETWAGQVECPDSHAKSCAKNMEGKRKPCPCLNCREERV